jgi:hypothetical protein
MDTDIDMDLEIFRYRYRWASPKKMMNPYCFDVFFFPGTPRCIHIGVTPVNFLILTCHHACSWANKSCIQLWWQGSYPLFTDYDQPISHRLNCTSIQPTFSIHQNGLASRKCWFKNRVTHSRCYPAQKDQRPALDAGCPCVRRQCGAFRLHTTPDFWAQRWGRGLEGTSNSDPEELRDLPPL